MKEPSAPNSNSDKVIDAETIPCPDVHETESAHAMAVQRVRFTIRAMMVLVTLTAVWLYILMQASKYRARFPNNHSAWTLSD